MTFVYAMRKFPRSNCAPENTIISISLHRDQSITVKFTLAVKKMRNASKAFLLHIFCNLYKKKLPHIICSFLCWMENYTHFFNTMPISRKECNQLDGKRFYDCEHAKPKFPSSSTWDISLVAILLSSQIISLVYSFSQNKSKSIIKWEFASIS